MKPNTLIAVVTTIQPPTRAMKSFGKTLTRFRGQLLIVGDRKGPFDYSLPRSRLLTLQDQIGLPLDLPRLLPVNHYVRKNVGYLVAIGQNAPCIFETDDDNAAMSHWEPRNSRVDAIPVRRAGWCNVYHHFSKSVLWPRGFPLDEIAASRVAKPVQGALVRGAFSPIQQGLADGNPDVDAIWRLVLSRDIRFTSKQSLLLKRGVWCPFNSQNTWWWPEAYPLLYLPSFCTFRMTDIWRSFIAQRCIWEIGGGVAFHAPDVVQDRNEHNLLRDFEDEVPGYLSNGRICELLAELDLKRGAESVGANLRQCYERLVIHSILPKDELVLLDAWLSDLARVKGGLIL